MFILAHYLQHLDLSRLTIKTHLIKKEQDSLSSYFEANKDGVLIYFNKSEPKNASITEENQTTTPADSFSPSVVLRNSAALQIIGGDLENLTEIWPEQFKIFEYESEKDFARSTNLSLFEILKNCHLHKTEQVFIKIAQDPERG